MTITPDPTQTYQGKFLLTGLLTAALVQEQAHPDSPFKILDVRPVLDEHGTVLARLEVTMPSGTYVVSVHEPHHIREEEL